MIQKKKINRELRVRSHSKSAKFANVKRIFAYQVCLFCLEMHSSTFHDTCSSQIPGPDYRSFT